MEFSGSPLKATEHGQAVDIHHLTLRIHLERTVAGETDGAVGALNLEEAIPLDRDVEFLAGLGELALRENLGGRRHPGAVADFGARGHEIATAGIGARSAGGFLIEQILKLDLAALEAGGVHVREVVRDRVEIELLRLHAGGSGVERQIHEW